MKKKLAPGWKITPTKPISVGELKNYLMGIFKEQNPNYKPLEWTHYTWEEEGEQFSMWSNNHGMSTGDLGYERFNEAFTRECKRLANEL